MAFHLVAFRALVLLAAVSGLALGYTNKHNRARGPFGYHHGGPSQPERPERPSHLDKDDSGRSENNVAWQWMPDKHPQGGLSKPEDNAKYVVNPPSEFSYTANGGSRSWPAKFTGCQGSHQSPITILPRYTHEKWMPLLKFHRYWDNENTAHMNNTGKRVDVLLEGKREMPSLNGGPLTDEYEFAELHFHWGKNDKEGSEHTLNNHAFPMEAHLVHFKKEYGNAEEATKFSDGFAVVAFFFKVDKKDNNALLELTSHLRHIKRAFSKYDLPSAKSAFQWFQDEAVRNGAYFAYRGSLTTPPCSEVVIWIVYQNPIAISHHQLEQFRNLLTPEGKHIIENHRVLQKQSMPNLVHVL